MPRLSQAVFHPQNLNFLFIEGPEDGSLVDIKGTCEKGRCPIRPDLCSWGSWHAGAGYSVSQTERITTWRAKVWGGLVPALTTMASWSWKVQGSPYRVSGPPSQAKTSIAGHPAEDRSAQRVLRAPGSKGERARSAHRGPVSQKETPTSLPATVRPLMGASPILLLGSYDN